MVYKRKSCNYNYFTSSMAGSIPCHQIGDWEADFFVPTSQQKLLFIWILYMGAGKSDTVDGLMTVHVVTD